MALTESNMIGLGTQAPDFTLPDTMSGQSLGLSDIKGASGTVIIFSCNHCPYVIHVNSELIAIANAYKSKGINFVLISSNDVDNYPQDSPEKMKELGESLGYSFPYLYDESQEVALSYDAACTPDIYLFDGALKLYYRGRLDGSRPGNSIPLTGSDLRGAIDDLLEEKDPPTKQYPSAGCNIKWK
ncbi:MAG: thioredoxin family protein [Saprospiraceae bacterium]|nr:thioredoxin family protein [Saprospiraceae bacterium]